MPRGPAASTSTRTSPPGPYSPPSPRSRVLAPYPSLCRIKNPLSGIPKAQLLGDVEEFARQKELTDIVVLLKKGALVAQDPPSFEAIEELDEDDKVALRREITHKWSQPRILYLTIILCSIGAAVQYVLSRGFPSISNVARRACAGDGIRPVQTVPTCLSPQNSVFSPWQERQTMTRTTGLSVW